MSSIFKTSDYRITLILCLLASANEHGWCAGPQPTGDVGEVIQTTRISASTFELDVQPLLTRFGCNSGPCHGKSRGQNGFALSLLGFDADFDFDALVRQARGRRISPVAPEMSLLLRKATGQVPHGGGVRFR